MVKGMFGKTSQNIKVSKYYPIDCSKESKQSYLTLTTSLTFIYTFLVHPCLLSIILIFAPTLIDDSGFTL